MCFSEINIVSQCVHLIPHRGSDKVRSGIISGHHNLPTYEMSLKSDNVEFVRYCGGHFENGDR
jgi:hypothetical protein